MIIPRVTSYFYRTSYELLFIARVMSYCLLHELRVTSYFLTMSYNKDKNDKAVYDNKGLIKNYSLDSFFDKEPGTLH